MASLPEKKHLYEAIEACRPDSEDLEDLGLSPLAEALATDSTLAAQYQWAQAVDRQIAAAFADVSVPEGLETRIVEKLQAALLKPENPPASPPGTSPEAETPAGESAQGPTVQEELVVPDRLAGAASSLGKKEEEIAEPKSVPGPLDFLLDSSLLEEERLSEPPSVPGACGTVSSASSASSLGGHRIEALPETAMPETAGHGTFDLARPTGRKKTRRWVLAFGLCTAAAAVGLLVAFWPSDPGPILSTFQVQEAALQFALSESEEMFGSGEVWQGQESSGLWTVSRAIRVSGPIRVRKIQGLLGREGLAYDLENPAGTRATLYVVPVQQVGAVRVDEAVPAEPPRYEQTARTGGYCAAAWQEKGLLYMLVVYRDSRRSYYQFFVPQLVT